MRWIMVPAVSLILREIARHHSSYETPAQIWESPHHRPLAVLIASLRLLARRTYWSLLSLFYPRSTLLMTIPALIIYIIHTSVVHYLMAHTYNCSSRTPNFPMELAFCCVARHSCFIDHSCLLLSRSYNTSWPTSAPVYSRGQPRTC